MQEACVAVVFGDSMGCVEEGRGGGRKRWCLREGGRKRGRRGRAERASERASERVRETGRDRMHAAEQLVGRLVAPYPTSVPHTAYNHTLRQYRTPPTTRLARYPNPSPVPHSTLRWPSTGDGVGEGPIGGAGTRCSWAPSLSGSRAPPARDPPFSTALSVAHASPSVPHSPLHTHPHSVHRPPPQYCTLRCTRESAQCTRDPLSQCPNPRSPSRSGSVR
eukprot:2023867-Rhodomonas_salina.2